MENEEKYGADDISKNHLNFVSATTSKDLEKLIELAESVSKNLYDSDQELSDTLELYMWHLLVITGLSFIGLIGLTSKHSLGLDFIYSIIAGVSFCLVTFYVIGKIFKMRRKISLLRKDIIIEESVLRDLLEMLHEFENLSVYKHNFNTVNLAMLRMRIKRLYFTRR